MTPTTYYSTLSIMLFFFSVLSCLIALATWLGFRRRIRGTGAILTGFLCLTAGVTLVTIFRPFIDGRIIQAGGNLIEAIGSFMLLIGFSRILDRPLPRAIGVSLSVGIGIANAVSLAGYLLASWLWLSNLVEGLSNAIPALVISILLFNRRNAIERSTRAIVGSVFAFIALFFVAIAIFTLAIYTGIPLGAFPKALINMPNPIIWGSCMTCIALVVSHTVSGIVGLKLNESFEDAQNARIDLERANRELNAFQKQILIIFSEAFGFVTDELADHGRRVAIGTKATLLGLGYADDYAGFVAAAAMLHDIGKVRIPESILMKDGLLSAGEREIMQKHSEYGYGILCKSDIPFFKLAAAIAHEHHERWDGNGYPLGKRGRAISFEARIVAVIDAYDALLTRRSYKEVFAPDQAKAYILDNAGTLYDPDIAVAAMEALGTIAYDQGPYAAPAR